MSRRELVFRYSFFAVIATLVNLAAQRVVLLAGQTPIIFFSALGLGTAVGLVVKYILDKRWIFFDRSGGLRAHGTKFSLYTGMGIITTGVFWGTEATFWFVWQTDFMRELGAVLGLSVGYFVKYRLDRKYVFTARTSENVQ